ncbi:MAG: hypothetical protein E6R03_03640 [Hyphomicrobiaceae bacterium]|nr:MAG: hypothetical protein E6R03_03640 [Hyphomicrobiaceae bacterium]
MSAADEYLPRPGEFDPLADEPNAGGPAISPTDKRPASNPADVMRILTLGEVLTYEPPPGSFLVGDGVVELGGDALLYGPPGSYKGFAVGELMARGAWGHGNWLGFPVQTQFASLWLNFENRRRRLKTQFSKMHLPPDAEKFIFVTDIPSVWSLEDARLAKQLRQTIEARNIKLLIIDTVSSLTEDEMAKHFAAFFVSLNEILSGLEPRPAVLLVHHSRKPKEGDKGARALLNLISGHQTLQRRARSICYLGRVTDEFEERRVAAVWLKVSDSGESEGRKTALQLGDGGTLVEIPGFDWNEWQGGMSGGSSQREPRIREEHLREVFGNGLGAMRQADAAAALMEVAGVKRTAAYEALKTGEGGRFAHLLVRQPGTAVISLRPANSAGM